mmetsp:Transcript_29296/g.76917  ORF Transcript_29296/g.76917 Transcript_29296/m.76917 type:complete len:203 (+) Transcript_29296:116-724(+)
MFSKARLESGSSGGTCDEYGFVVPEQHVQKYREHSQKMANRRQEIRDQWTVLLKEIKEQGLQIDASITSRSEAIEAFGAKTRSCRKLVRGPVIQGIPPEMRPTLWPLLCGVEKARAARGEQVYPSLLQRCEGKERNRELELDLDRTFPGHPLLDRESAHGDLGIASLHRVLNSYALHNPQVGYCQVDAQVPVCRIGHGDTRK